MPRSGPQGTATPPPGTFPKNPGDTIPSAAWNQLFSDLYGIANTPVPIAYGGTGQSDLILPANLFGIKDSVDPTKIAKFDVSAFPTATAPVYALPAVSGKLALEVGIYAISASVSANALTISLKGADGNDPSASNPVNIAFRNSAPVAGAPVTVAVTAASSLVISSGSTLGAPTGNVPFKLWIVAFNDAGTFRLGVINATTLVAGALVQYPLSAWGIASSTAEGGAGAADSAQTFYTGAAVASKAYAVLGYLSFEGGLATAGTWASVPTRTQLFDNSVHLPGDIVQRVRTAATSLSSQAGLIPRDDTIPQITEGSEYMSRVVAASSAANIMHYVASGIWAVDTNDNPTLALFRNGVSDALAATGESPGGINNVTTLSAEAYTVAATTSAITFSARAGGTSGSLTFNGLLGSRLYGGVSGSYNMVEEIAS